MTPRRLPRYRRSVGERASIVPSGGLSVAEQIKLTTPVPSNRKEDPVSCGLSVAEQIKLTTATKKHRNAA
jgi:hypothetical protein